MAAEYPAAIPTIPADKTDGKPMGGDHPAHHNKLADELVAVTGVLGTLPAGAFPTVKARLERIDKTGAVVSTEPPPAESDYPVGTVWYQVANTAAIPVQVIATYVVASVYDPFAVVDTMTGSNGTLLTNHAPDKGPYQWVLHPGHTPVAVLYNGRCRAPDTTTCMMQVTWEPAATNYFVETIYNPRNDLIAHGGVIACASTSVNSYYSARLNRAFGGATSVEFLVIDGGTVVAFSYATRPIPSITWATGTDALIRLEMRPGNQRIYANGELAATLNHTLFPGPGRTGIRMASTSGSTDFVGMHCASFQAGPLED